jgi:hypothetical protein
MLTQGWVRAAIPARWPLRGHITSSGIDLDFQQQEPGFSDILSGGHVSNLAGGRLRADGTDLRESMGISSGGQDASRLARNLAA